MSNDQITTQPIFNTGDRVVYVGGQLEDEALGTVIAVETIVQYKYIVEWDDDDPTDEYAAHQLGYAAHQLSAEE